MTDDGHGWSIRINAAGARHPQFLYLNKKEPVPRGAQLYFSTHGFKFLTSALLKIILMLQGTSSNTVFWVPRKTCYRRNCVTDNETFYIECLSIRIKKLTLLISLCSKKPCIGGPHLYFPSFSFWNIYCCIFLTI